MNKSFDVLITTKIPQHLYEKISNCGLSCFFWDKEGPIPSDVIRKNIPGVKGVLCTLSDHLDSDLLSIAGSSLKTISTISVGFDHIDIDYLKQNKITLGYTPGILTEATAETAISLLLATSRKLFEANAMLKEGLWNSWQLFQFCGKQISHSTVGIFGLGKIGKSIAVKVSAFKPRELFYTGSGRIKDDVFLAQYEDRTLIAKYLEKDDFISNCDVIIVSCSLNKETEGYFNKSVFDRMKKNTIFVNVSRGKVVNQTDLINVLNSGHLFGAGLDVMYPEPIPTNDELLTAKNCTLLPHIGSATIETRTEMCEISVDNLLAGLEGRPLHSEYKL